MPAGIEDRVASVGRRKLGNAAGKSCPARLPGRSEIPPLHEP